MMSSVFYASSNVNALLLFVLQQGALRNEFAQTWVSSTTFMFINDLHLQISFPFRLSSVRSEYIILILLFIVWTRRTDKEA